MLDEPGLELEAGVVTAEVDAHAIDHPSPGPGTAARDRGALWRGERRARPPRRLGPADPVDVAAAGGPRGRGPGAGLRLRAYAASGRPWPRGRSSTFGVGLALLLWTTCGFLEAYADSLFWVWTSQTLVLWLIVPVVLLVRATRCSSRARCARPGAGSSGCCARARAVACQPADRPGARPAAVRPSCSSGRCRAGPSTTPPVGWLLQLLLVAVGAVMVLPLVGLDDDVTSLAVGPGAGASARSSWSSTRCPGSCCGCTTPPARRPTSTTGSHSWAPSRAARPAAWPARSCGPSPSSSTCRSCCWSSGAGCASTPRTPPRSTRCWRPSGTPRAATRTPGRPARRRTRRRAGRALVGQRPGDAAPAARARG